EALVAEGRRQPDVDDRNVGLLEHDRMDEGVLVRDGGDDLEAAVPEQSREAVAQKREILGDHDAHGITAWTNVGPPGGLVTAHAPSSAWTRRRSPARPDPARSAPPRPSSVTSTTRLAPSCATRTIPCVAPACFAALVSASATTK